MVWMTVASQQIGCYERQVMEEKNASSYINIGESYMYIYNLDYIDISHPREWKHDLYRIRVFFCHLFGYVSRQILILIQ